MHDPGPVRSDCGEVTIQQITGRLPYWPGMVVRMPLGPSNSLED